MNVSNNIEIELQSDLVLPNYIKFINKYVSSLSFEEITLYIYLYENAKFNLDNIILNETKDSTLLNLQMVELIDIEFDSEETLKRIIVKNPEYFIKTNIEEEVDEKLNDNEFFQTFVRLNIQNETKELTTLAKYCSLNNFSKQEFEKRFFSSLNHNENKIDTSKFMDESSEEVVNNYEDIIKQFEKYDSFVFLKKVSNGRKLNNTEQKIITSLRENYKLPDAVINVLLDYVIRINEGNINKSLVESIASAWSRNNLKSAKSAMEFVKKYNNKKNKPKKGNISPEWLNEEESKNEKTDSNIDLYERFKEL